MSLRIIGGAFRNRILKTPKGAQTRPTLAVMRKAVFDILQMEIEGAHFLDLYAGSGAMGLEALSRGASQATFVEANRHAFSCIEENTRLLEVQDRCALFSYDTMIALKKLAKEGRKFDIVYVDPPYAPGAKLRLLQEILLFFDTHPLLNPGGRLFLEEASPPALKTEELGLATLRHADSRTFSRSVLHQFQMTR
ncbi:MAG: 16S rRNA (guanine(966)-N(2))-methyltransferase RsmD [Verrucomicrobia bacterium]|nr:16S rRNA (guanine(966)-N(2))-methyltransferase RsmD [Verrucomicrobiota bacterium]